MNRWLILSLLLWGGIVCLQAEDEVSLQDRLGDLALEGDWFYDDLKGARAASKELGKPLLIVFRCVP